VVASGASSDHVFPGMGTAQMFWDDMIDGQFITMLPTVLAGEIIPAKYLFAR